MARRRTYANGFRFFKKAVELQKKYLPKGSIYSNGLQTNATLIDDEFAKFLGENNFLVGVSLDGPDYMHNHYRVTANDKGSHQMVLDAIARLDKYNVQYNILTLVNSLNVKEPLKVYNYLKENIKTNYFQFIPCVEFIDNEKMEFAITGKEWGEFLIAIYDEWVKEDVNKISIRDFDSLINLLMFGQYSSCNAQGNCCQYFVVEHNGEIYPCDFFVRKDLLLGNVFDDQFGDLVNSQKYIAFGALKSKWDDKCKSCKYLGYCSGGCLKDRMHSNNPSTNLSPLCDGYIMFYDHTLDGFKAICQMAAQAFIKEGRLPKNFRIKGEPGKDTGRNDICFCGSNKKYKKCHGQYAN